MKYQMLIHQIKDNIVSYPDMRYFIIDNRLEAAEQEKLITS